MFGFHQGVYKWSTDYTTTYATSHTTTYATSHTTTYATSHTTSHVTSVSATTSYTTTYNTSHVTSYVGINGPYYNGNTYWSTNGSSDGDTNMTLSWFGWWMSNVSGANDSQAYNRTSYYYNGYTWYRGAQVGYTARGGIYQISRAETMSHTTTYATSHITSHVTTVSGTTTYTTTYNTSHVTTYNTSHVTTYNTSHTTNRITNFYQ